MDYYQVLVLGGDRAGTLALLESFIDRQAPEYYDPTLEDYGYRKRIIVDDQPCMLDPIYLFSHEHYSAVFQMHVREARAFVIVYSIHDRQSFDDVPRRWGNVQEARKALVGYGHPEVMDVGWPVMVVAKDYFKGAPVAEREVLERVVSKQEGERIAEELEAKYVEVCSETRDGVDDAFVMLARSIRARIALKVEKGGSRPTGLKSVGRLKQNTETAKNEDESSGCSKRKCVVS